jgi:hypothetical protein
LSVVPHPIPFIPDVWWRKDYPLNKASRFYQWNTQFSKYDIQFHNVGLSLFSAPGCSVVPAHFFVRCSSACRFWGSARVAGGAWIDVLLSLALFAGTSINMTMNAARRRAIPLARL